MISPRMATALVMFVMAVGFSYWVWSGGGQMTTINAAANPPSTASVR